MKENNIEEEKNMKTTLFFLAKRGVALMVIFAFLAMGYSSAQEQTSKTTVPFKEKSEDLALALSVGGALLPWAMSLIPISVSPELSWLYGGVHAAGLVFGPSLGYFYGGLLGRGLIGPGVRILGFGLAVAAGTALAGDNPIAALAIAPILAGGVIAVYTVTTVIDITGVRKAVRKRNQKMKNTALLFTPTISPQTKTVGISVQVRF